MDKTLSEIKVEFHDYGRLHAIVEEYKTSEGEKELASLASSSMRLKSEFLCFVFAIEKKYGPVCVQSLLNAAVLKRFNRACCERLVPSRDAAGQTAKQRLE